MKRAPIVPMPRVQRWLPMCATLGCLAGLVAACEPPPTPRRYSAPKNGTATSHQTKGDDDEDGDATKPKSCLATCRDKNKAVLAIHDAHVTCVKDCDEDASCTADCDDERATECDGSEACNKLDACLAACE
jgi:hypothetical protein